MEGDREEDSKRQRRREKSRKTLGILFWGREHIKEAGKGGKSKGHEDLEKG